jgi:hypothetical protein
MNSLDGYTKQQLAEIIIDLVGQKRYWDIRDECSLSSNRSAVIIQTSRDLTAI